MKRRTPEGTVFVQGRDDAAREEAVRLTLAADKTAPLAEVRSLGDLDVWLKGGPLRGRASLRHSLRRHLLRRPVPRINEYLNLVWLQKRLFRVPEPICAAALHVRGAVRYQLLVTATQPDALPLPAFLSNATPEARTALIDELAEEVGRLHALYFVHRDLFPRNLLVTELATELATGGTDARRLVFLDVWRGGPYHRARGPHYDLACLMLEGANLFTPFEQRRLFERYLAARAHQGRPARAEVLLARTARAREKLLSGVEREPGRWRLSDPPKHGWSWSDVLA